MTSAPISVTGGVDGITARCEDLLAVGVILDRAATDAEELVEFANSWLPVYRLEVEARLNPVDLFTLLAVLGEFGPPWGAAALTAVRLRGNAFLLRAAAESYRHTDSSVFDGLSHALLSLPGAVGDGALRLAQGSGFADAGQAALSDDPYLVDVLADATAGSMEPWVAARYPDGHARVNGLGIDTRRGARTPPRGLRDLITELSVRNEGRAGEISVAFLTGADGRRRVIVDIPGTKSWSPGRTPDITSLSTNARALVGAPTSYAQGVLTAMAAAGVTSHDEVMLVGHSEGGMVAVEVARDGARSKQFRITHVVTAGSPIGRTVGSVPTGVRVLALENAPDVIPHADGVANPDRRNVTTVTVHHGDKQIVDDHDLPDSYVSGAHDGDVSHNPSVRDFIASARGFFDSTRVETHAYLVTRSYK